MTTMTPQDCSIVLDIRTNNEDWCVFEHQAVLKEGEPPQVILVHASRLVDAYRLIQGKTNSEWARIFENGGKVLVRIIATFSDKAEAYRYATAKAQSYDQVPVCNLNGYNLANSRRSIICLQNQKRYDTQGEAAKDLGISAPSISRHLRGDLSHVGGFTFTYAAPERRV